MELDVTVTEREVRRAMADSCSTAPGTDYLAYIRHIDGIDLVDVTAARNFVDMTSDNDVDGDAERLLSELRDDYVLPACNVQRFTVSWVSPDGLNTVSHEDYLNRFCNTFYSLVYGFLRFIIATWTTYCIHVNEAGEIQKRRLFFRILSLAHFWIRTSTVIDCVERRQNTSLFNVKTLMQTDKCSRSKQVSDDHFGRNSSLICLDLRHCFMALNRGKPH